MCEVSLKSSYLVTDMIDIGKKKKKIVLDSSITFSLYINEIMQFHIKKDQYLEASVYHGTISELLLKRAKLRAINLLTARDMTEYALRTKLKEGYYSEEIIECVMQSLQDYGYINDRRYAENYIQYHSATKSKYQITAYLRQKGIHKDVIAEAMNSIDFDYTLREKMVIKNLILKRNFDIIHMDIKERQKIFGYLTRRGFQIDLINCVIDEIVNK